MDFPELRVLVCPAAFCQGVPVGRICCPRLRTAMLSRILECRAKVWRGGGQEVGSGMGMFERAQEVGVGGREGRRGWGVEG